MMGYNNGLFGHSPAFMGAGHGLWLLVIGLLLVVPFWRICQRAGFAGWWSLLILFPVLNLVLIYYLAFADWPSQSRQDRFLDQ